jgi:GNAT superfamily N-acetyltransferase
VHIEILEEGAPLFEESLELRYRVMYEPFGLGRELAPGVPGPAWVHLAAIEEDRLMGYGRLAFLPGGEGVAEGGRKAKVYQLVVEPSRQCGGIGTALMRRLEELARERGVRRLVLDARLPAVGFYERLGYRTAGPEFLMPRTRMPHLPMARDLGTSADIAAGSVP